ncbi:hypothetical protein [Anaerolinea thermolimosa]|uniref:hypothetical protein n=1 Tax=Anaerolinea thermolimosa TaxID=229919 RepID=UPI0013B39ADC|nr:hypothetical protein [Anaerolinea thermolimosa]
MVDARQTYYSADGKPVARLCGRTLKKKARASSHMLRRPPAWAIDLQILEAARRDGATQVEVLDVETRRIYRASIDAFALHGFKLNRGHGDQIGLALSHWKVEARGAAQLALFGVRDGRP